MRAVVYQEFRRLPEVVSAPDPTCPPGGVVVAVESTGLCRSDWHGWMGHDPDIRLPHIPGHEFAGTVVEVGRDVRVWWVGARVTAPFVLACGRCATCLRGDQQVCEHQIQAGFTHPGSFAELVAIDRADVNLVAVPEDLDFDAAASLGCRFATAYRAVVQLGAVGPDHRVVVHGCGGVGLSAVMIAVARGAEVIAVDVEQRSLDLALALGATVALDATTGVVPDMVRDVADGGADVSIDALGSVETMQNSLRCLRRRGRHLQIGLLAGADACPPVPMDLVIGSELEVLGSHGMAAATYGPMMAEIAAGVLQPQRLVRDRIGLDDVPARLASLDSADAAVGGITMIRPRRP
jgi:alcohol dehydrogenase